MGYLELKLKITYNDVCCVKRIADSLKPIVQFPTE